MDYIYCNAREQRINILVCQNNILKGKCHKTLLECRPARTPRTTEPDPAPITDTQDEPEPQDNNGLASIQSGEGQLDLFNFITERK
jgi:hypothetical protein